LLHGARQEPLGRVLLEAAASHVAVIATDVGGTSEIFDSHDSQHHHAAILIRDLASKCTNDLACEFAKYLTILLASETLRNVLINQANRIVNERFEAEKLAHSIYFHYTSLVE